MVGATEENSEKLQPASDQDRQGLGLDKRMLKGARLSCGEGGAKSHWLPASLI